MVLVKVFKDESLLVGYEVSFLWVFRIFMNHSKVNSLSSGVYVKQNHVTNSKYYLLCRVTNAWVPSTIIPCLVRNSFGLSDSLFIESKIPLDFRIALDRVRNSFTHSDSFFVESESVMCKSESRYVSFNFSVSLIKEFVFLFSSLRQCTNK